MLIQIAVLACMLLLPEHAGYQVINAIILPLISIFPVCTMLVGSVLMRQQDRRKSARDLIENQKLLNREQSMMRGLIDSLPDLISFKDAKGLQLLQQQLSIILTLPPH
jgi:hypothetical protein